MSKTYCAGGGSIPAEVRFQQGMLHDTLGKCGTCERILKVTTNGRLRKHSVRGKNTASHDKTLEILWEHAKTERQVHEHFAIGLSVYVRLGSLPVGWGDGDFVPDYWYVSDYDRRHQITAVHEATATEGSSFEAGGWFWAPENLTVA